MSTQRPLRAAYLFILLFVTTIVSADQSWEYLVKTYPLLGNDQALTQTLNKLGMQQWLLVNCAKGNAQLTCIFKRQLKDD